MTALVVAVVYAATGAAALELTRWSTGLAVLWPANAILLFHLLRSRPADWAPATLLVLFASAVANISGGTTPAIASVFAVANIVECLTAAGLFRLFMHKRIDLDYPAHLWTFVVACVVGTVLSSSISAVTLSVSTGAPFLAGLRTWFMSDLLGLLIITPMLLVGAQTMRRGRAAGRLRWPRTSMILILGLVAGTSTLVFAQQTYPLLTLIFPTVLLATFRFRGIGATLAIMIVAVIGSWATISGSGPISLIDGSTAERLSFLQLFLAVTFLCTLPVAAVLAERDRFAHKVSESEARFRTLVDVVGEVIFRTDPAGHWTFLNPAWETMTGYDIDDSLGRSFLHHVLAEDRGRLLENLAPLYAGKVDSVRQKARFCREDGEVRWVEVLSHALYDPDGAVTGTAGTILDITDRILLETYADEARVRAEQDAIEANRLAATDELTGLWSRRAFMSRLNDAIRDCGSSGTPLSVAIYDVDHFKRVNDTLGHAAGDAVLRRLASISGRCVREGDTIGRLGGEEFAIIMPGAGLDQAIRIGERLRKTCSSHVRASDDGDPVTISIGVAMSTGGLDADALLHRADEALYRAKADGRNCLRRAA
jgi:diguanylate cyclase (GGDEF)-like protein/PAS domain S-box-containing protein